MNARLRAAAMLFVARTALSAQANIGGGVVDSSGRPLENASITMTPRGRYARTDSAGRFEFIRVAPGKYKLHVRKISFAPAVTDVVVGKEPLRFRFVLNELVQTLEPVNVTASCPRFQLEGFYCRERRAGGVFFDPQAIDSAHPRFIQDLFRTVPGFNTIAVKGGTAIVSTAGWRCVNFVVDGHASSIPNHNIAWPKDLLGLELYANPDSVPPEYSHFVWGTTSGAQARCSVVVAWSATYPRK